MSGPIKGVLCLGQGQMPGYPRGVYSVDLVLLHPPVVLVQNADGSARRGILRGVF